MPNLKTITTAFVLAFTFCLNLAHANGHKGISLGMQESELPKTWKRSLISYEGEHEGDFFRVTVIDRRVVSMEILYAAETADRTAVVRKMTLAQSIKEHSLAKGTDISLGIAKGRDGRAWGIVDIPNRIAYAVAVPPLQDAVVDRVSYLSASAPVIATAESNLLDKAVLGSLLSAVTSATIAAPVTFVPPSIRYAFQSRPEALRNITELVDRSIGAGKRTVALMNSSETWLSVDPRHPEAQSIFMDLRRFRQNFIENFETLIRTYKANEAQLAKTDIFLLDETFKLNETIQRRMTQLRSMGFPEY